MEKVLNKDTLKGRVLRRPYERHEPTTILIRGEHQPSANVKHSTR
jgi:hypothetical protein